MNEQLDWTTATFPDIARDIARMMEGREDDEEDNCLFRPEDAPTEDGAHDYCGDSYDGSGRERSSR